MALALTQTQLVKILKDRSDRSTQSMVAKELGISSPFLSDMLRGKRDVSENIARKLGYRKIVTFVKI